MTSVGPVRAIEYETDAPTPQLPDPPRDRPDARRRVAIVAVIALALATLVAVRLLDDPVDPALTAEPAGTPAIAPVPAAESTPATTDLPAPAEPSEFTPWPDPPQNHAPGVSGSPRTGELLVPGGRGLTLVYVNTIGRPTVLDLENGQRQELHVSPVRSFDFFLVEDGHVVDANPLDPDLPAGTSDAVPFFVHQSPATGTLGPSDVPSFFAGPHLCLEVEGCAGLWWDEASLDTAGYELRRARLEEIPEVVALSDGVSWVPMGRFLEPTADDGPDFRIPAPRPDAEIWVMRRR